MRDVWKRGQIDARADSRTVRVIIGTGREDVGSPSSLGLRQRSVLDRDDLEEEVEEEEEEEREEAH